MTYRIVAVAALAGLPLPACGRAPGAAPQRQAEVAARGARVMPFDLDRTRHHFEDLPDGGLQTVTALDPADTASIRLIRGHLAVEAARFARGEFDDPMAIHGHDMPGVAELRAAAGKLAVSYAEQDDGGRIRYTSADPGVVAAVHKWFEAQRSDHGRHAR